MKYGAIRGIDLPVARLVFGTAALTGASTAPAQLLDQVLAAGGNTFDTARVYGLGASERALGAWMQARRVRDKVVVITKGGHPHLVTFRSRLDRGSITADLLRSLKALRTDYVDLYLLHRDDASLPVDAILETLNELLRRGLVRAFGVSNWTHPRVEEANRRARERGITECAASSPHFSLAEWRRPPFPGCVSIAGAPGSEARTWYQVSGMPVLAWSSLAGGYFARPAGGRAPLLADRAYRLPANDARRERVRALAARKGFTAPQIALAYVFSRPLNIFPIVSTRSIRRFQENAAALDIRLTHQESRWLEEGVTD